MFANTVPWIALVSVSAVAHAGEPTDYRVYVGTYTGGESKGIYLLTMDAASGRLGTPALACETTNPSFLAMHPTKPVLFAVGDAESGTASAFRVDAATGKLTLINGQPTQGRSACHVSVATSGRHIAVANYTTGSITVLPVREDGSLGEATAHVTHEGRGPNAQRQDAPHAHSVNFDASGRHLLAADLGIDKILVYRYDERQGTLKPNDPAFAPLAPGAGPRHVAFHPSGRFLYVVNELDSTVTGFAYDANAGALRTLQTVTTLPADFHGENTTAEVRVHPSGRFLYASNRGHDSIAVFAVDIETGKLTSIAHTATGGHTPRHFSLDPAGRFLLAANQDSNSVVAFRVNPEHGTLEPTGQRVHVPMPVCVLFARP